MFGLLRFLLGLKREPRPRSETVYIPANIAAGKELITRDDQVAPYCLRTVPNCPTAPVVKKAAEAAKKPKTRVKTSQPTITRKAEKPRDVLPEKKREESYGDASDIILSAGLIAGMDSFDSSPSSPSSDSSSDFSGGGGDFGGGGSSGDY